MRPALAKRQLVSENPLSRKGDIVMAIGQRHLFTWLHLSDLHFGHGDKTYGWNQKTVLRLLASDIKNALKEWPELPRPQAIVVTGDIAFSGGKRDGKEYLDANEFLQDLTKSLELQPNKVFLVPGNHDVQRDEAKDLVEQVRGQADALDTILSTPQQRAALLARQDNYKRFADGFAVRDLVGWTETVAVPVFGDITLLGLNTAMISNDDLDLGQLGLAGEQRDLLSTTKGQVRLLLTHHPFEGGWLHDEESLRSMAQRHLTVHICGHVHDPRVDLVSQAGGQHHHVRVVAAAAHRDPKEAKAGKDSHGYNFASLMVDAKGILQVRTWPRRWFPKWTSFRVDHLGVPDRRFYDDKSLGKELVGSGLVLDKAGTAGIHWWGEPEVRWNELLSGKKKVEVYGIAVRTLFSQPNSDHVKDLLNRGGEVHVVLADPRCKTSMARYDEDFGTPLGDRCKKVVDVLKLLKELRTQLRDKTRLSVYLTRYTFKYSAYRIDGDVLFVPYRMIPGKKTRDTPAFVLDGDSRIVQRFLGSDLDALRESAELLTPKSLNRILSTVSQ